MSINLINNGDSGLTARNIINTLINVANSSSGFPYTGSAIISGSLNVTDEVAADLFMHPQNITADMNIPAGYNGFLIDPVSVTGTITVDPTANLVILSNDPSIDTSIFATTGSNTFIGDQNISGNITSSGDLRFTTAGNAVVRPIIDLALNGTASLPDLSSNTTAISSYGINVVSTVSSTNYCCLLPQPVKGKTVTFVNISGAPFYVFPSQTGGSINGVNNGYFQIPNDGKSYSFDCYENPLPGGWSSTVPTPTGNTTLTSDIITSSLGNFGSATDTLAFVNNATQTAGTGTSTFNSPNFLANTIYSSPAYIQSSGPGIGVSAFINPYNTPWKQLNSVKIVTNLIGSANIGPGFVNTFGSECYEQGTTIEPFQDPTLSGTLMGSPYTPDPGYLAVQSSVASFFYNNCGYTPGGFGYGNLLGTSGYRGPIYGGSQSGPINCSNIVVPGTFTPGPDANTSANPGDPGTLTMDLVILPTNPFFKSIGLSYVTSFTRTTNGLVNNTAGSSFDLWYFNNIGFVIYNFGPALPYLKFYVEYNVDL